MKWTLLLVLWVVVSVPVLEWWLGKDTTKLKTEAALTIGAELALNKSPEFIQGLTRDKSSVCITLQCTVESAELVDVSVSRDPRHTNMLVLRAVWRGMTNWMEVMP